MAGFPGRASALQVACQAVCVAAGVGALGNALQYLDGGPFLQLCSSIVSVCVLGIHLWLVRLLRLGNHTPAVGRAMAWAIVAWLTVVAMLETEGGVWLTLCFGCTYCALLGYLVFLRPRTWHFLSALMFPVLLLARHGYRPFITLSDPIELVFCAVAGGVATWAIASWTMALFLSLGRALTESTAARTQLAAMNRALIGARDEALVANRTKDQFLANMSHELRTPLNAIIGYSEMLREEIADPDAREDIDAVLAASGHLLSLVSSVLDLARIDAGDVATSLEAVDLRSLVAEIGRTARPLCTASGNHYMEALAPLEGLPPMTVDPVLVQQVLLNLLGNAAKFTRGGQITLRAALDDRAVKIEVCDTGIGIAPDEQTRIFERFAQVDGSATKVHGGLGLGLAIARSLTERLGGTLGVESVPGQGSIFTLRLPRLATESEGDASSVSRRPRGPSARGR